ncbi:hypothetical protein BC835DRAFT_1378667, partial [Cytidiella melzeri]
HGGYNIAKRDSYKEIIYSGTIQSMRAILDAMPELDIQLSLRNDANSQPSSARQCSSRTMLRC